MSHGAAAVLCCVRVIGTCVTCVTCAGRATMTRTGGGGEGGGDHRKVCRGTCRDMGKLQYITCVEASTRVRSVGLNRIFIWERNCPIYLVTCKKCVPLVVDRLP